MPGVTWQRHEVRVSCCALASTSHATALVPTFQQRSYGGAWGRRSVTGPGGSISTKRWLSVLQRACVPCHRICVHAHIQFQQGPLLHLICCYQCPVCSPKVQLHECRLQGGGRCVLDVTQQGHEAHLSCCALASTSFPTAVVPSFNKIRQGV